jgi:hypothetical protein
MRRFRMYLPLTRRGRRQTPLGTPSACTSTSEADEAILPRSRPRGNKSASEYWGAWRCWWRGPENLGIKRRLNGVARDQASSPGVVIGCQDGSIKFGVAACLSFVAQIAEAAPRESQIRRATVFPDDWPLLTNASPRTSIRKRGRVSPITQLAASVRPI